MHYKSKNKFKNALKEVNVIKHMIKIIMRKNVYEKTIVNNEKVDKETVYKESRSTLWFAFGTLIPVIIGTAFQDEIKDAGILFAILFSVVMYLLITYFIIKILKIDVNKKMRQVIAITVCSTAIGAFASVILPVSTFEWGLILLLFCFDKISNPIDSVSKYVWRVAFWANVGTMVYMFIQYAVSFL